MLASLWRGIGKVQQNQSIAKSLTEGIREAFFPMGSGGRLKICSDYFFVFHSDTSFSKAEIWAFWNWLIRL